MGRAIWSNRCKRINISSPRHHTGSISLSTSSLTDQCHSHAGTGSLRNNRTGNHYLTDTRNHKRPLQRHGSRPIHLTNRIPAIIRLSRSTGSPANLSSPHHRLSRKRNSRRGPDDKQNPCPHNSLSHSCPDAAGAHHHHPRREPQHPYHSRRPPVPDPKGIKKFHHQRRRQNDNHTARRPNTNYVII